MQKTMTASLKTGPLAILILKCLVEICHGVEQPYDKSEFKGSFLPKTANPHLGGHWHISTDDPAYSKREIGTDQRISPTVNYKAKTHKKSVPINDFRPRIQGNSYSNFDDSVNLSNERLLLQRNFALKGKVVPKQEGEHPNDYAFQVLKVTENSHRPKSNVFEESKPNRGNPNGMFLVSDQYHDRDTRKAELEKRVNPHAKDHSERENERIFIPNTNVRYTPEYQSPSSERQLPYLSRHRNILFQGTSLGETKNVVPTGNGQKEKLSGTSAFTWNEDKVGQGGTKGTLDTENGDPYSLRRGDPTSRQGFGASIKDMPQAVSHRTYASEKSTNQRNYMLGSIEEQRGKGQDEFLKENEGTYASGDHHRNEFSRSSAAAAREEEKTTHSDYLPDIKQIHGVGQPPLREMKKNKKYAYGETSEQDNLMRLTSGKQANTNSSMTPARDTDKKFAQDEMNVGLRYSGTSKERSDTPKDLDSLHKAKGNYRSTTQREKWNSGSLAVKKEIPIGGPSGRSDKLDPVKIDVTKKAVRASKNKPQSQRVIQRRTGTRTKGGVSGILSKHKKTREKLGRRVGQIAQDSEKDHLKAEEAAYHWGMEKHRDVEGYFQYINNPREDIYEYGFRMGSPEYMQERYHHTSGTHSKTKVNWEDEAGNFGDQYWEFNHGTPKKAAGHRTPPSSDSSQYVDYENK